MHSILSLKSGVIGFLLEAANVAKMGYRWFIGDGKILSFGRITN